MHRIHPSVFRERVEESGSEQWEIASHERTSEINLILALYKIYEADTTYKRKEF